MSAMEDAYTQGEETAELRPESSEYYLQLFVQCPDALLILDSRLRVQDVNPAFEHITGYSRNDIIIPDRFPYLRYQ